MDPFIPRESESMAERHPKLDSSDVLQLLTLLKGVHSHLGPQSVSVLTTAGKALGMAASSEGIRGHSG
jgi:hypothetical protein